jgi:hypothetical protein
MYWWIVCIACEERRWGAGFHDVVFAFAIMRYICKVFSVNSVFWKHFSINVDVSEYGAQEKQEEILSAFKCKVKARAKWKARIWCECGNHMQKRTVSDTRKIKSHLQKYLLSFHVEITSHKVAQGNIWSQQNKYFKQSWWNSVYNNIHAVWT